ncbi:acyl-CoA dehydrogenase family protein [Rhodococcus sp. 3Y1]
MRFDATELTIEELALQADVREYLDKRLTPGTYSLGLGMAGAVDPVFSRDLGRRGWLGMSLPKEYGGGGRSAVDRLVVVEELRAGSAGRLSLDRRQTVGSEHRRQRHGRTEAVLPSRYRER